MPRWCLLPGFSIAFLIQEALTTTATLLDRESFETSSNLQKRGINVLDDKYFIPAIATSAALVLLALVCLYFLGCCCNSKKMDDFYTKAAVPARPTVRHSASLQRPTVNLNTAENSDRYSNISHPKTPPHTTPPAPPSVRLHQLDSQNAQQWSNGNQWPPTMVPPTTSHGYQSTITHTAVPPSVMSVSYRNPTAASYQYRDYDRPQMQRPNVQSDARRMSSMSSVTSSATQIGSGYGGGGEQAPYVYSPHQGNTLSYASSSGQSGVAPVWEGPMIPRNPTNGNGGQMGAVSVEKPVQSQQMPGVSGPPAYMDDSKGRPVDIRKS